MRMLALLLISCLSLASSSAFALTVDYSANVGTGITSVAQDGFNVSQTNAGTFGFLPQFGLLTLQEENLVPVSEFVFTKVGGGLFTLDGLTLTSFVRIQGTTLLGIQFQGFVNGVLKAVDVFKNTGEFVTEFVSSFNFSGVPIDELRFSFDNLVTGAAIQSFTVDTNVAVVPEPSTALLLGLGLAGLAGKGRRRNRS